MTVTMPLTTFGNRDITVPASHNAVITDSYDVIITTVLTECQNTHTHLWTG